MTISPKNNLSSPSRQKPIVRNARIQDISELATTIVSSFYDFPEIFNWLYPVLKFTIGEDLRYRLHSRLPLYNCFVATIGTENRQPLVVGTVEVSLKVSLWSSTPQYPYISNLAVKDSYRRQGIAQQLLAQCETTAYNWGYDTIQLHVLECNHSAKQLYLKNGYQVICKETSWNEFFTSNSGRLLLRKKIIMT